ncbi:ImuA family protein [Oceanibium sediminis]|uniref:ImuA family protein n=1 Tax=Oceanibium sediminis TaxID=2026339 RepID=UPI001E5F7E04|nr:hypothetical protein [Oceanibium sediminis]
MHPRAMDVLDRLALNPRPGHGAARIDTGVAALDARLGGGLEQGALHEVRAPLARDLGAASGVLLGLLSRLCKGSGRSRVLWVMDPGVTPDAGLPCPDGIAQYGLDPGGITLVHAVDLRAALWAADEGARCTDLAAVVLQVKGNPARLDRLATRRLMLRARNSSVCVLILRQSGAAEASAAQTRWCVTPRPSAGDPALPRGIGPPAFQLTLERSRSGQTGHWPVHWTPATRGFAHDPSPDIPAPQDAAPLRGAGLSAPADRPDRTRAMGRVVDFGRTP